MKEKVTSGGLSFVSLLQLVIASIVLRCTVVTACAVVTARLCVQTDRAAVQSAAINLHRGCANSYVPAFACRQYVCVGRTFVV